MDKPKLILRNKARLTRRILEYGNYIVCCSNIDKSA